MFPVLASEPITRQPSPTAGEALNGRPSVWRQISLPSSRPTAYRLPSFEPTMTRLSTITGELSTCDLVEKVQTFAPVSRLMQCSFLSCEPAITYLSLTAADESYRPFASEYAQ